MTERCRPAWVWRVALRVFLIGIACMGASCSPTHAATIRQRIETASTVGTLETDGREVLRVQTSQQNVLLELRDSRTTTVILYDLNGTERTRYPGSDAEVAAITGASINRDGRTLIVYEDAGPDKSKATVLGDQGQIRFSLDTKTSLLPSPMGRYFCTLYNPVTYPAFILYDSLGSPISNTIHTGPQWSCDFIDDDHLIVIGSNDTLFIATPSSGVCSAAVPVPFACPSAVPSIAVSPIDSLIAVYDQSNLSLLSFEGDLLWTESFTDHLYELSFSDDSHWLCLQFGIGGTKEGYIRLQSTLDPTNRVDSQPLADLPDYLIDTWCERLWFNHNVVTMCAPNGMELCQIDTSRQYWTLFISYDPQTHRLGPPEIVDGLFHPLPADRGSSRLLELKQHQDVILLSVSEDKR